MTRAVLATALLACVPVELAAKTEIPRGKWSFLFTDAKGRTDRPLRVYTYRPRECDTRCPIVFVMHGLNRTASRYRDYWELEADARKLLIVAPQFSKGHWPEDAYNLGDLAAQPDREKWAFSAIEHLFDEVRDGHNGYAIFGHSAGGQFVQRMAFFRPDHRATAMVGANPGWYTFPEWRKDKASHPFPYSLVQARAGEPELRQALQRRFLLLPGEKDVDPQHKDLTRSAGAMRQGEHRLERGENFFEAATAAAAELGVKLGWELSQVPTVAHDGGAMSKAAAEAIYGKR